MILSAEHDDCLNWARWVKDNNPRIGYPRKWSLPEVPDWHLDEDKHSRELDAFEAAYDERRAAATDLLFRIWLDRARRFHDRLAKRHFRILRAAYLLRRNVGELTVCESLRALADLKLAQSRAKDAAGSLRLHRLAFQAMPLAQDD